MGKFICFLREDFQIIHLVEVMVDCDMIREVGDLLVTQTTQAVFLFRVFRVVPVVFIIIILQGHLMACQMFLYGPPSPVDLLLADFTLEHWSSQVGLREYLVVVQQGTGVLDREMICDVGDGHQALTNITLDHFVLKPGQTVVLGSVLSLGSHLLHVGLEVELVRVPQVRPDGGTHPLDVLLTDLTPPVRNLQLGRGEPGLVGVEGRGVNIVKMVTKISNGEFTGAQQALVDLDLVPG